MGVEDLVKRAPTRELVINEYLDIPEDDTAEYKVVIRKMTVEEGLDLYKAMGGGEKASFNDMVKTLLCGVISTPFEKWDEDKIRWLDKTNRDLFLAIFMEVSNFNAPLDQKTEPISDTPQS